jgi:DNA ligase-associated metallophosphoesterase
MNITLAGQGVTLLPERAMYLHATQSLLIADAHLGKAAAFRKLGVPVPGGTTARNLELISRLITRTQARELIFLGDLFHNAVALDAKFSNVMAKWCEWRAAHASLEVTLIVGNHDAKAFKRHALPQACGIDIANDFARRENMELWHELPAGYIKSREYYPISGHIHPGIMLTGRARDALRAPCFWLGQTAGVMPAFGDFTGMHLITPQAGDAVYVIAEDEAVIKLPST